MGQWKNTRKTRKGRNQPNGSPVDPRWKVDYQNGVGHVGLHPDGGNRYRETYDDARYYSHIETRIDGTRPFSVQCAHYGYYAYEVGMAVYWDDQTYVKLEGGWYETYFGSRVRDGTPGNDPVWTDSGMLGEWDYVAVRMEFDADVIRFYAKIASADDPEADRAAGFTHLSVCDIPRIGAFKQPGARLVVGKGSQPKGAAGSDFDNSMGGLDGHTLSVTYVEYDLLPLPPPKGTLFIIR